MINFDEVDKVTNVICKPTPSLMVRHVLVLRTPSQFPNQPPKNYEFDYMISKNQFSKAGKTGVGMFFGYDTAYLEFETRHQSIAKDSGKMVNNNIKNVITMRDVPMLLQVMDQAYTWLSGSAGIYVRDVDGRPVKISDPLLTVGCPIRTGNLAFKPCIIRDANNVRYEGIAMGTKKDGEIANFTAPEFASFRIVLQGFVNNYYVANMLSANQAMNYCIHRNLMEALNKNANANKPK